MKFYVGVTDNTWFKNLKERGCSEVNFWKPGAQPFGVLKQGDLFLFKLHAPYNYIVGGGQFVSYSILPIALAWETFGKENGTKDFNEFYTKIMKYKNGKPEEHNPVIGCIVLSNVFYFDQEDWIAAPEDWSKAIVSGKTYDAQSVIGFNIYSQVRERLSMQSFRNTAPSYVVENRYTDVLTRQRLGQGAFRVLVTDAYKRRCAISGEKTLPVLQAAHIRPYSEEGPHLVQNGLLLRSDMHTLFDNGYITVDEDYRINVSKSLHEDYGNGKDYYKFHGKELLILPDNKEERPSKDFLLWHNEHVYKG